jgi:uncharacterized membrane protein YccC
MSTSATPRKPLSGVFYAVRVLIVTTIVWLVLTVLGDDNPIWGLISLVTVSEPELETTVFNFKSRFLNTIIGAAIGLALLVAIPKPYEQYWAVPVGMAAAVLFCTAVFAAPGNWKIAPITVGLVMAAGVREQSRAVGLETAWKRTGEVLLGSLVAVAVTWVALRLAGPRRPPDGDRHPG